MLNNFPAKTFDVPSKPPIKSDEGNSQENIKNFLVRVVPKEKKRKGKSKSIILLLDQFIDKACSTFLFLPSIGQTSKVKLTN